MRVNPLKSGLVGAVVVVLSAAGCGPNSQQNTTAPSGFFSASTVAALSSPEVTIFNVDAAGTPAEGRGPCAFDRGSAKFACDDRRGNGLNFTRTVTYYDASGAVQSAYDATTTASIRTETSVSGTTTTREGTATINRTGVMVVTGLAGAETTHTLNGSEQGTVAITGTGKDGVAVTSNHTVSDTTVNLVVPAGQGSVFRGDRRGHPLSGTRTHAVTTTTTRGTETKTESSTRKETFDGTAIVQIELTINGVTQNCTMNLETRQSTCRR